MVKNVVFSAGTNPTTVNSLAIKALFEIGVNISKQTSKGIEEFSETEIDLTVVVCQNSAKTLCALCSSPTVAARKRPLIINAKLHKTKAYVVHGFDDPLEVEGTEEEKLAAFRCARDKIKVWITDYFADLKCQPR